VPRFRSKRWRSAEFRAGAAAAALVASLVTACTTPPKPHPSLRIPASEFLARIDTFCIAGVSVSLDLEEREERAREFEDLLAAELDARGFESVPSEETARLWAEVSDSGDGVFDPHTGARIDDRYAKLRERFLDAVSTQLGCDALISGTVVVVQAPFLQGAVSWDHVSESIASNFFAELHAYGASGWVSALSLWIRVKDLRDEEIYFRTAGIEPLVQVNQQFTGPTAVPIQESAILRDAARKTHAVGIALGALPSK